MRKTAVPSAGIPRRSCTEPMAIQYGWAPRPAAHPGVLCCSPQHCSASWQALPYSEPWGLKITDTKANTVSLLAMSDTFTGSLPQKQPSCFHTIYWERKGGLHEFGLSNLACSWCTQGVLPTYAWRWHCTGASKPWQALGKLINNCTRNPPFQTESALGHRACSGWSWFWPDACL